MDTVRNVINCSTCFGGVVLDYSLGVAKEQICKAIKTQPKIANLYQKLTGLNPTNQPACTKHQIGRAIHNAIRYLSLLRVLWCAKSIVLGSLTPIGQLTTAVFWLYIYQSNNRAQNINNERDVSAKSRFS